MHQILVKILNYELLEENRQILSKPESEENFSKLNSKYRCISALQTRS